MLDLITHEVRGIIWLTDKPLANFPSCFQELNYLFDGLIGQHVANASHGSLGSEKNVFIGRSFDRDIVLIQIYGFEKTERLKILHDTVPIIPGQSEHANVLLIAKEDSSQLAKDLKKKFGFRFKYFEH